VEVEAQEAPQDLFNLVLLVDLAAGALITKSVVWVLLGKATLAGVGI